MKNRYGTIMVICVLAAFLCGFNGKTAGHDAATSNVIAPLKVQGNRIVDPEGNTVVLKGLNICYPSIIKQTGHWSEDYFRELAGWGAKLVRVPIDPGSYRRLGARGTFEMLDEAIRWSKKYGMYVIIDWHSIGNPVSGIFQDPWQEDLRTTEKEMKEFWREAARRYKDEPAAPFYEIFNEPAAMTWKGGSLPWEKWRDMADDIIDVIYAENPRAIPVVGGLEWAYDLTGEAKAPLRNKGIVFAVHPYPGGHGGQPREDEWDRNFGFLTKDNPVIITEFGYDPEDKIMPEVYKADDDYGRRIIAYADNNGMSWTAFVFCNCEGWPMPLFKDWETYSPTESGAFFKEQLNKR